MNENTILADSSIYMYTRAINTISNEMPDETKLQKPNKEIVDAFVAEIVVYAKDRAEIKWEV